MIKNHKGKGIKAAIVMVSILLLAGCANKEIPQQPVQAEKPSQSAAAMEAGAAKGAYDSADTCVLISKNADKNTITFYNLDKNRQYTLSMDGATNLCDKYGEALSLGQIGIGSLVDITFIKNSKYLVSLQKSAEEFCYENVEKYSIDRVKKEVNIGNEFYKLDEGILYVADEQPIDAEEISEMDILTFYGTGNRITCVKVVKGHGYLSLMGQEAFLGGWISVGEKLISKITEDMLLVIAEGSYEVNVSNRQNIGTKSVIINRNEETCLDLSDIEIKKPEEGRVNFLLTPSGASLYVDGVLMEAVTDCVMTYGLHQIIVKADGYQSITRYLKVGQELSNVSIDLEREKAADEESKESGNEGTGSEEETYQVTIEAPKDVEVYLDGNYIGISPVSFEKKAGSHVIILRKTGYASKTYQLQVDDSKKDITYTFADLTAQPVGGLDGLDSAVGNVDDLLNNLLSEF